MLKIVNQTGYSWWYELWDYATSTQITNGYLEPTQIAAYQFDTVPSDGQSAIYCFMNRYLPDGPSGEAGTMIEQGINLPANSSVTIATQIMTGYLRPSSSSSE